MWARAEECRIVSFTPDGLLTWTNRVTSLYARLEWVPRLGDSWQPLPALPYWDIPITNHTTTVPLPPSSQWSAPAAFIRVACTTNDMDPFIRAELHYWPQSTDQWWLNFKVFTRNAIGVYVTSSVIRRQYDLFLCGTWEDRQYWWSANNPDCIVGDNNYNIGYQPTLPFDVNVHIVKPEGEQTSQVTISTYVIHP